ncbi:MAG: dienelactone hydrolase family protein [Candidatus Binatia bacterium]
MSEEVKTLVNEYQEGKMSRRQFIRKAVLIAGSVELAMKLIGFFSPSVARAAMVDPQDPTLVSSELKYKGKAGQVSAYLSRPKASGTYPGLIVIHENRGINDHIRDVARRLAKEGYVALAPDYLSRLGGTKKVNPKGKGIRGLRKMISTEAIIEDTKSGYSYLQSLSAVQGGRIGIVGFCWGGANAFMLTTKVRGLKAAVIYYGTTPRPIDLVQNIEAPILAHYGGADKRVSKGVPATVEAMKKYHKSFTYKVYPGAKHAFNNDTRASRYHPEAAKEAWGRTLRFFKKHLKG